MLSSLPPAFLLLAFFPLDPAANHGLSTPLLDRDPSRQWQISSQEPWREFRQRWGSRWSARFDERNGTPRFLYAPGVSLELDELLVADVARLAGVEPGELSFARQTRRFDGDHYREIRQWTRRWRGAEVAGEQIALVAVDGKVGGVWVNLSPIRLDLEPEEGEIVLPLHLKGESRFSARGVQHHLVRRVEGRASSAQDTDPGPFVAFFDRQDQEIWRYDTRIPASVSVSHYERTVTDAHTTDPAREVSVRSTSGAVETTDSAGLHGLSGSLTVSLDGPHLQVFENTTPISVSGTDDMLLTGGSNISQAAAMSLHNFHVVWDWLGERWPTLSWLDQKVYSYVDYTSSYCNAWYGSDTMVFLEDYPGYCNNLGEIADVLYHEMGHGVHEHILAAGTFDSDISEGSADYLSATITGDPYLAPDAYPGGYAIREIESDYVYPTHYTGESHANGQIWGSFLWDLREAWISSMGEEVGIEAADLLFLGALEQGPTLLDAYEAVILADDDDGDLSDGTPHACELQALLNEHGIGPGPIGVVLFDHEPLADQPSSAESYPLEFDVYQLFDGCSDFDEASVELWYTLGDGPAPGTPEADLIGDTGGGSPFDGWSSLALDHKGDTWSGVIPRQPATTRIRYFITAGTLDRSESVWSHGGDPNELYDFYVGDMEALWCEGFESGAAGWESGTGAPDTASDASFVDEWVIGSPAGGYAFDPTSAPEGLNVATTVLDGEYRNLNAQYLRSPALRVTEPGRMLQLRYQRWLSVEDALYDHAQLWINGAEVFRNRATAAGNVATIDTRWRRHALDLDDHLGKAGELQFTWSLVTDPGLEFGGWAIDDVCVVQLADLPGHYRVKDLSASDDLDKSVHITWTQPWIVPLVGTTLVRKEGGWPESPVDGIVLDFDKEPVPGETRELTDKTVKPDTTYYYALFASDGEWYTELVEGENADTGALRVPADTSDTSDTSDTGDTSEPKDTQETDAQDDSETLDTERPTGDDSGLPLVGKGGCACSSKSGGGQGAGLAGLLAGLALLWSRGRKRVF